MPMLFLCGDVMTGRGIDQILADPCSPGIQEPYVRDARDYVALAEEANGPIARPVAPGYFWEMRWQNSHSRVRHLLWKFLDLSDSAIGRSALAIGRSALWDPYVPRIEPPVCQ
jgi:poly-gamma-glutamate capsule biosynthesis protein CapA/YwtB (metallophosphatase superfamily)